MAGKQPEIVLTDIAGERLQVDALAYPEDTYLVVDPYSPVRAPVQSIPDLIVEAEADLPRSLGEIISIHLKSVAAATVFRLVLLDFSNPCPCQAHVVERTVRRLMREGVALGVRHLGLDRFELLEPCISAYRLLSFVLKETTHLQVSRVISLETLTFAVHHPATLRRYQVALAHLPKG